MMTTLAPALANIRADSRPIPRDEPVMSATLPVRSMLCEPSVMKIPFPFRRSAWLHYEAMPVPPVDIVIYSRRNCCLCDEAKDAIAAAARRHALSVKVSEVDIDLEPRLHELYTNEVPVVFVAGRKAFKFRVSEPELVARVQRAAVRGGQG